MLSELYWLRFSFASALLQSAGNAGFAFSPGHYASVKTPYLHHKRRHLRGRHLDDGYVLFTPSRDLPEIIYLQVQVRLTSRVQPGDSEGLAGREWEPSGPQS